jgi:hypothetical protein
MIKYNKIITHRIYKFDFDKREVICLKCKHKVDFKTFAYSLLNFAGD